MEWGTRAWWWVSLGTVFLNPRYLSSIPGALFIVVCLESPAGQLQLESLPHPVVAHLLPFFKMLASFLENGICQGDVFSDKDYWMVKFLINLSCTKQLL